MGDKRGPLRRQLFAHTARIRHKNGMERRWLEGKLSTLDKGWHRQEHLLNREINQLEENLRLTAMTEMAMEESGFGEDGTDQEQTEKRTDSEPVRGPEQDSDISVFEVTEECLPASSSYMGRKRRILSAPEPRWKRSTSNYSAPSSFYWLKRNSNDQSKQSTTVTSCRYGQSGASCRHFPCCSPRNVNLNVDNLYGRGKPRHKSAPLPSVDNSLSTVSSPSYSAASDTWIHPHDRLIHRLEMTSVRRPQRSSLLQTLQKEKSIKKILADSKIRSAREYPADWCTNYGKPTSKRKLYTAARPNSMDDFKGIL